MPVDAEVDSDVTLLLVVDRPEDSEATPLDAEVDSDVTLLLVVDRPEDSEATPLDAEVDSDVTLLFVVESWLKFTASVLFDPGATPVTVTPPVPWVRVRAEVLLVDAPPGKN
jgi:hypothetical protein